ncbi:MAG: TetR/AcrR family transcriptional regulator [Eubacteriaceae bacterium]|jgi:AcrR family transcriptional regulator|nr:TetR/AcrR family transcriptional regulator [Eubacteriaceae bacterium]
MAKNDSDLRVVRTKMNIKNAFMELIRKKPVEKITVTELAKAAMINKGTFYLHYQDIPVLYKEVILEQTGKGLEKVDFSLVIKEPEKFLIHFSEVFSEMKIKEKFPEIGPTAFNSQLPLMMSSEFRNRMYAGNELECTNENDLKLDCIYSCLFCVTLQHNDSRPETAVRVFADIVRALFEE